MAMVLEAYVTGLGHIRKIWIEIWKLAVCNHLFPLIGPQVEFKGSFTVHLVRNGTFIGDDLSRVPLHRAICILRIRRNQVVETSCPAVSVFSQGIVDVGSEIIQDLVFRCGVQDLIN